MKILEINKFYHERRGAERHFLDLVALLKKNNEEVEVFAMAHPKNLFSRFSRFFPSFVGYNREEASFGQRLKGLGRLWSFEARHGIKCLLAEWQPEVIHLHNIYHQLSPSILAPLQRTGAPVVMTLHDYNLISPDKDAYYPEVGKRYWKFLFVRKYSFFKRILLVVKKYYEGIGRVYEKNIDHYLAPSRYTERIFIQAGVPQEKITVLPHFVSKENPKAQASDVKESNYALYFGSISKEKNVEELLSICERLKLSLVLCGPSTLHFQNSSSVTFLPFQSQGSLRRLIQESLLVVSASRLPETFGLIALEANIEGKPFFGYETGAYPEIITNGANGWLAKDREELEEKISLFRNQELSLLPSAEIIARTEEKFGEQQYLAKLLSLFRKLRLEEEEVRQDRR